MGSCRGDRNTDQLKKLDPDKLTEMKEVIRAKNWLLL
jgi:hypothetical protein